MGRSEFRALVGNALDDIPERLGSRMSNVAVTVAQWPTARQIGPGPPGRTLLGLYEGVALTRRSPLSYDAAMPDRITIRTTVIHEVAHHFGISDSRLDELGWA